MARRPKPWWWKPRGCWFVQIAGQRHNLGPNRNEAMRALPRADGPTTPASCRGEFCPGYCRCISGMDAEAPRAGTYLWYKDRLQDFAVGSQPDSQPAETVSHSALGGHSPELVRRTQARLHHCRSTGISVGRESGVHRENPDPANRKADCWQARADCHRGRIQHDSGGDERRGVPGLGHYGVGNRRPPPGAGSSGISPRRSREFAMGLAPARGKDEASAEARVSHGPSP